ncbi:HdaA/DnaA family protein [Sphingomonas sp. CFBP 8760]|uniref:HdaA/DnaA family protein n=1 Tax=Sphingomonas sp. CFBP 8760 TaxID=2775282 RepID=UPI001780D10F|nr:DnaA/Hda family protein [Sphingomonas sp. CFBP 8760]MBD8547351.1 chromosomal replication initiator DnaA [Sphingomonas sp. CFBP 8760]
MSQMALPLGWPADPRDDAFLVTPSNAQAVQLLERWGNWPVRTAILTGPRRSGRSLLARIFAAKSGGMIVDDAERVDETDLFHLWNRAQEERRPFVIVADQPPPIWAVTLPDLRTRLAASPHGELHPPDDALAIALLDRLFARRGLDARSDLIEWLVARIERSHLAIERVVDALDQGSLERHRRLTIPLARITLIQAGLIPGKAEDA